MKKRLKKQKRMLTAMQGFLMVVLACCALSLDSAQSWLPVLIGAAAGVGLLAVSYRSEQLKIEQEDRRERGCF